MAPSTDEIRSRVAERIEGTQVPAAAFALVGASRQARQLVGSAADDLRTRWTRSQASKDRLVTTAMQLQAEAEETVQALPGVIRARAAAAPGQARDQIIDLRDAVVRTYDGLVLEGERVVTVWRAEQLMNDRVDAVKGLTPGAARAAVAARDAARRAAASPTVRAMGQAAQGPR